MKNLFSILQFLLVLIIFSACVPAKKYKDLLEREKVCSEEFVKFKKSSGEYESLSKYLQTKFANASKDLSKLIQDTTTLGSKYRLLLRDYSIIDGEYKSLQKSFDKLKNDLNQNLTEISSLKIKLINKNDSLIIISNELHKIKTKTQNTYSNISENNYDLLVPKFGNKEKDISEYNKWLANIVAKDMDGDTSYMTKKCTDYIYDVIDFNWGYDGSIDEKTLNKKWTKQYDLKYSNFWHLFETGNGGWGTKKLTKVEFLGELNGGDWFKLTIKGGGGTNDFSTTLVRVIKVIKKGNAFYIDNFLSLTEE